MSELLEKKEDLIRYFQTGAKPRAQWRIGTEYEKVVVRTADGTAIPYSGSGGVEALLRRMAEDYGFEPEDEHGHILALKGARAQITLEPGGQIELSGEQCDTIHCAREEFATHVQQLIEVDQQNWRDGARPRHATRQPHRPDRAAAEGPLPHHVPVHGAQGDAWASA